MKRIFLPALILLILTGGCNTAIQPPTPQAEMVEISADMTRSAVATAAALEVTATATATVTATPPVETLETNDTETVFRDDFNSNLEPGWTWLNENPAAWSLNQVPGSLQIFAEPGYINFGSARNVLLRDAPEGDFGVETSLNFFPDTNDQFAGIVLLESTRDYLQVGLGYCLSALGCPGRGFYVNIYRNSKFTLPRNSTRFTKSVVVIRLTVQNGDISVFTSPDGIVWYRSFQQPVDINVVQVGLFAGQNYDPPIIPAVFEYFELKSFK